ncbi:MULTISPECIES: 5-oxoprolinase subunit PxpB [unclassified Tenacibaculum]|uniref:5-oxoprolinase subunit PxpB n=1 Tax=unclassified Tenacibaculum TaxID=2635139 RepID=UPI001F157517|nr:MULTISPECIES: 5-oxoprolinase subunit PxpB [unclassified Tenacibaculum]MCF2875501.1 5-oxoprolinase subunit PxpB [Tenacibaculum sp. Cn5-1]MCF2935577.1 5-oxoprolinase subunit PxpB [Tenacibaculum sp. Cn5-34]MCG7512137.1 5-oxoprolinase subunit PxpB [Tenacibaculum sp. Cn5-46]
MFKKPTYTFFGERTILIEWRAIISEEIIRDITRFEQFVNSEKSELIEDSIVGYHSLMLVYKEEPKKQEITSLQELYEDSSVIAEVSNYLWEIPVCYESQLGIDLQELAKNLELTSEELVQKHSAPQYSVYFIGFLPGFLYLGGLEKCLHFPRKATPRLKVAKGSVAIGGGQTGIYPQESAGGWNIIGQTPISLFDITKETPCFAKSGDKIQFVPITLSEYEKIVEQKEKYQLTKTLLDD